MVDGDVFFLLLLVYVWFACFSCGQCVVCHLFFWVFVFFCQVGKVVVSDFFL